MEFLYQCHPQLPKLAWLARWSRGAEVVEILHGSAVEVHPTCYFEGAWAEPYGDRAFDQSCFFFGSGGTLGSHDIRFVGATHTLERLVSATYHETLFVSNSLSFLLAAANLNLDPQRTSYTTELRSARWGLKKCVRSIPTQEGVPIRIHLYCNLRVAADLTVQEEPKPEPPLFGDFAAYRALLVRTLAQVRDNAADTRRVWPYTDLLATSSTGYDSPACSCLAAEVGCCEGVTLRGSRSLLRKDVDDRGTKILEHLGLRVTEFSSAGFREIHGVELEAEACADGGASLSLGILQDRLPSRILVTGFNGDKMWDRVNRKVNRNFERGDASGMALNEFRLRIGFIHLAVPFIAAYRQPEIHAITLSEEMQPWTLGTAYDRPIPRRIAEECGIPREWFGQVKKVVSIGQTPPNDETLASRRAFIEEVRRLRDPREQLWHNVCHRLGAWWRRGGSVARRLGLYAGVNFEVPDPFPRRFYDSPGEGSYFVLWGVSVLRARYASAIAQKPEVA